VVGATSSEGFFWCSVKTASEFYAPFDTKFNFTLQISTALYWQLCNYASR